MRQNVELVGVLNITPDSFSDGGQFIDPAAAIAHANQLMLQGASLLDIGAESTRPGAEPLTPDEEWARLQPVLSSLISAYPDCISLDTYHPETVRRAARECGQFIINDVTAFNNPEMIEAAVDLSLRCVVSHLPTHVGQDIQAAHKSPRLLRSGEQVRSELLARREEMIESGVSPGHIILDPGIGFGKAPELNMQLIQFAQLVPGIDVMIGYSRKRFLGEERMEAGPNLAAGQLAIASGARYLRVHDVAAHARLLGDMQRADIS